MGKREGLATCRTGAKRERIEVVGTQRITPIDVERECIQRSRIDDGTRQRCDAVFVDRHHRIQRHCRIHVVDQHGFAVRTYARVIVGHTDVDRVGVLRGRRWVIVQVLVRQCKRLAARRTGTERVLLGVVGRQRIAPVHIQRKCVQRSRISNRTCQCRNAVFADRHDRIQRHRGRHVVYHDGFAVRPHARIVVRDRGVDRVGVLRRSGGVVVQVLVRQRKRLAAGRAGAERVLLDVIRRQRIAPIHIQRECIQRSRIDNRPGQRCRAVLVDGSDWV